jgi:hypothetical protein
MPEAVFVRRDGTIRALTSYREPALFVGYVRERGRRREDGRAVDFARISRARDSSGNPTGPTGAEELERIARWGRLGMGKMSPSLKF